MAELRSIAGYHNVAKDKAKEIISPFNKRNGFYMLRPSTDTQGTVLCTICVTHDSRVLNYRVSKDSVKRTYYINQSTQFSSMADLIAYYKHHPLNENTGSKLVSPVVTGAVPTVNGDDCYVVMEKPDTPISHQPSQKALGSRFKDRPLPAEPNPPARSHSPAHHSSQPTHRQVAGSQNPLGANLMVSPSQHRSPITPPEIPGLHKNLTKSMLKLAMKPYLGKDGYYLLRPSSSSESQLTLTVSQGGQILNFKISNKHDKCFITPKMKFNSVPEMIAFYHSNPIRSKQRQVLFTHPIPEDPNLTADSKEQDQQQQQQKEQDQEPPRAAALSPGTLPSPWVEYYSEQHGRHYYHNPESGITIWEKPTVPCVTSPSHKQSEKSKRIQSRPLPSIPQEVSQENVRQPSSPVIRTNTMPICHTRPPVGKSGRGPLPQIPQDSPVHGPFANNPLSSPIGKRPPAPLPGQENMPPAGPPANRSSWRHHSIGAGSRQRSLLPTKEEESEKKIPPNLPQKESETKPPKMQLPQLPAKEGFPLLPEKETSPGPPAKQQQEPSSGEKKVWKRVGIFEGSAQPPVLPGTKNKTAPPPLPEKEKSPPPLSRSGLRSSIKNAPPTSKQTESEYDEVPVGPVNLPPLPRKEKENKVTPALPPKEDEPTPSPASPPPAPPPRALPPPLPEKEVEIEEKKTSTPTTSQRRTSSAQGKCSPSPSPSPTNGPSSTPSTNSTPQWGSFKVCRKGSQK